MQKWGTHPSGTQRYRCLKCHDNGVRKRDDLIQKYRRILYQKWLLSKFTLSDFGNSYKVDRRTLDRWFKPFRDQDLLANEVNCRGKVVVIDGYYLQYGATVLVAQMTENTVIGWSFTYAENYTTWLGFFYTIKSFPLAIVCDGQKGMLKAIKLRWPGIVIQRCQFHVIHQVNILLTKHPETMAATQFKDLVNEITDVKTRDDLGSWLIQYRSWYRQYQLFFKERTYQEYTTSTGRRKWHYTHGHLHAANSHLKNALPNLFQYLRYPEIPNTSNRIEGGINALIQRRIDSHRGTTLFQRRQIIAGLLRQKQLQKPTRNVT